MKTNNYLAWYRKYRPQIFSDVVGQQYIVQSLKNIVKGQQYFHAFLFAGPRGTGKTSLAKIFANTLNCQHKRDVFMPCDFCINNVNNSLDIIEMDAASNNGVKEIRELIDNISTLPQNSPFKIYILDEAHMLTTSAFNAFLKTLEEPPRHVIFILATTEVHKIPITILSRLQRYNFSKAQTHEIVDRLAFILKNEGVKYEIKALENIAKLSEGSLRDAISLLEQSAIYSYGNIQQSTVENLFGVTSNSKLISFVNNLASENLNSALKDLNEIFNQNKQPRLFLHQLIELIKSWLIYKSNGSSEMITDFSQDEIRELQIDKNFAHKCLLAIYETIRELVYKDNPLTYLEIMVIKIISKKAIEKTTSEIPVAEPSSYKNISKTIVQPSYKVEDKTEEKIKINYQTQNETSMFSGASWKNDIELVVNNKSVENTVPDELRINENLDLDQQFQIDENKQNSNDFKPISNSFEQFVGKKNEIELPTQNANPIESEVEQDLQEEDDLSQKIEQPASKQTNSDLEFVQKHRKIEDDLSTDEAMNLIMLGKIFTKNSPQDWSQIQEKYKIALNTYELDEDFSDIIIVLKNSRLLLSDKTFLLFAPTKPDFYYALANIKNNVNLKKFIVKVFGYAMHFFVIKNEIMNESIEQLKKIKEQGIKYITKPLKPIEENQITKDEIKKMIFSK